MGADDLGIQSREMVVDGALLALGSFLERMTVREMVRRRGGYNVRGRPCKHEAVVQERHNLERYNQKKPSILAKRVRARRRGR